MRQPSSIDRFPTLLPRARDCRGFVIPGQPEGLSPESITTSRRGRHIDARSCEQQPPVVMDSGLALRAPQNDDREGAIRLRRKLIFVSHLNSIRKIRIFRNKILVYLPPIPRRRRGVCPGAGIKLAKMIDERRWLQSPVRRGERGISRKPSCGECWIVRRTCGDLLACFFHCTQGCGCVWCPAFPEPFDFRGTRMMHNSDAFAPRGC